MRKPPRHEVTKPTKPTAAGPETAEVTRAEPLVIFVSWCLRGYVFAVDSAINVVANFKNMVVAGGKFDSGAHDNRALKSIAAREVAVGVKDVAAISVESVIFPNPVKSGGEVIIENNIAAKHFRLYDITGKLATDVLIGPDNNVQVPRVPAGLYIVELSNINGEKAVSKLVIE